MKAHGLLFGANILFNEATLNHAKHSMRSQEDLLGDACVYHCRRLKFDMRIFSAKEDPMMLNKSPGLLFGAKILTMKILFLIEALGHYSECPGTICC